MTMNGRLQKPQEDGRNTIGSESAESEDGKGREECEEGKGGCFARCCCCRHRHCRRRKSTKSPFLAVDPQMCPTSKEQKQRTTKEERRVLARRPSPPPPPSNSLLPSSPSSSSSASSSTEEEAEDCSDGTPSSPLPNPQLLKHRRNAVTDRSVMAYCKLLMENSTLHGIRDTFQTKGLLRAVWLTIVLLATLAALVGCVLIVDEFYTGPLSVTVSIREDVNLTLPDIVVCPFNRFNRTFLQSLNVSDQLTQYLELAFPSPAHHPFQYRLYTELITPTRMDELEQELNVLLSGLASIDNNKESFVDQNNTAAMTTGTVMMSFTELIKRAAISCEAFFADPSTCSTAEEIMTSAGKCFRLQGVQQNSDGFGHGQRIILRLPKHLYNPGVNQMLNDGVVVKLAERGRGIDHDMSFVPSGVHAIFPLTATRYEFMNYPPHFKCREDDTTGIYSRVWCFEDCFMSQAERTCNCSLAAASRPATPNICTTSKFFRCVYPELYSHGFEERIAHCKSHCGPPCNFWRFDKTVTYSHFPSEQARHFVDAPSKWEELQNTIILDVYYITLDYTIIRHMLSMTAPSFVAQLGGQFSLWIGGSIISITQIVIYLSGAFHAAVRRNKRRKEHRLDTLEEEERQQSLRKGRKHKERRKEGRMSRREEEAEGEGMKEERQRRRRRRGNDERRRRGGRTHHGKNGDINSGVIFMSARV